MCLLSVAGVCKREQNNVLVSDVSFTQEVGQKIAIAGETGSGKSSLLKIIAGLVQADNGEVLFEKQKVFGPNEKLLPGHQHISYLSQQFELPRFYTVENVLAYENQLSEDNATIIYEVCRITELLERNTDQLSGGEKQRISFARALIASPKLLLLDEPYSNLDMVHKSVLKKVIEEIGSQLNITCILVSHDPLDTLSWADTILVLKNGQLLQKGTPEEIYKKPRDIYTGALFGSYNIIHPTDRYTSLPGMSLKGKSLFARPEEFKFVKEDSRAMRGEVLKVTYYGSYYEIEVMISNTLIIARSLENNVTRGEIVFIHWTPSDIWYI